MVSTWTRSTPRALGLLVMVASFFFLLTSDYSVVDASNSLNHPDLLDENEKIEKINDILNKYPRDDQMMGRSNDPQKNATVTKVRDDMEVFNQALDVFRQTNSTKDYERVKQVFAHVLQLYQEAQALKDGGKGSILGTILTVVGGGALVVALALVCNNCAKKRKTGGATAQAQALKVKSSRSISSKKATSKIGNKKVGSSTGSSSAGGKPVSTGTASSGPPVSVTAPSNAKSSTGAAKSASSSGTKPASSSASSTGSATSGSATSSVSSTGAAVSVTAPSSVKSSTGAGKPASSTGSAASSAVSNGPSSTGPAVSVTAPSRAAASSTAAKSSTDPKPASKTGP